GGISLFFKLYHQVLPEILLLSSACIKAVSICGFMSAATRSWFSRNVMAVSSTLSVANAHQQWSWSACVSPWLTVVMSDCIGLSAPCVRLLAAMRVSVTSAGLSRTRARRSATEAPPFCIGILNPPCDTRPNEQFLCRFLQVRTHIGRVIGRQKERLFVIGRVAQKAIIDFDQAFQKRLLHRRL